MNHPDPREADRRIERSFDPAGEREPGVPPDAEDHHEHPHHFRSPASAGEAAERSADVGGVPGAIPDDLARDRGRPAR
jgi:hypothetical protein